MSRRPPAQPADWAEQTVHAALVRVMRDVMQVGKTEVNTEHPDKFVFRGIDAVVNAVGPILRKHGVLCLPKLLNLSSRDVRTGDGGASREVTVTVRYTFYGPLGDERPVEVPGEAIDYGDKAVTKAMSVAWRTALIQALNIPTGDPDPDLANYRRQQQDAAAEGSQDRQGTARRTPSPPASEQARDRRYNQWQGILARGEELGWPPAQVKADFARWSGGLEIDGPIETTTQAMLTSYRHTMGTPNSHYAPPGATAYAAEPEPVAADAQPVDGAVDESSAAEGVGDGEG